jgi:DNA-binding transcriptional regulator PaaX
MPRGSLTKSVVTAWWALGKFAARPYSVTSHFDLWADLGELGFGTFRAVQKRFTGESWNRREAEPAGRWVERLREELAPLAFQEADPRTCWDRRWDQKWRLVAYDIPSRPQARRQKLWRWLKQNRLGQLQRSLWVSAKPLEEIRNLFQEAANSHTLLLWEAPTPVGLHPVSIVEQAWKMGDIDSGYQSVLNFTSEDPSPENICKATFRWHQAVQEDPLLPRSLYPKSFRGFRATDQLEKMWSKFRLAGA